MRGIAERRKEKEELEGKTAREADAVAEVS
jgi:hypothetical protein